MRFGMEIPQKKLFKIEEILSILDENKISFKFYGDKTIEIFGMSHIKKIKRNTICYFESTNGLFEGDDVVFVCKNKEISKNCIIVEDPKMVFYLLSNLLNLKEKYYNRFIDPSCVLGKNVAIGESYISKGVKWIVTGKPFLDLQQ